MSARSYRIAPRTRARGSAASRVKWDKLGRVVLVLVLFAIVALYVRPLINFVDSWQGSKAEQVTRAQLAAENATLHRRAAVLSNPNAAEQAARRMGMVASGERSYAVRGLAR